jgi:antitoxin component YwqK of YwqJK toxin-antitoxin module
MEINFDEIEFDPTTPTYKVTASYRGEPFTGTALCIDENFGTHYQWPYKNGKAYGRWFGINPNTGITINEENYVDGKCHGSCKDWFENGLPKLVSEYDNDVLQYSKLWNNEQILIRHFDLLEKIDKEYYDNGSIYFDTIHGESKSGSMKVYYDRQGRWLEKTEIDITRPSTLRCIFNEELLFKDIDELDSRFHYNIIVSYVRFLRESNEIMASEFLLKLIKHSESAFKAEAMIRLGQMKIVSAIDELKTYLEDKTIPMRYTRFEGRQPCNIYTLGELASRNVDLILQ